ncbi:response regulator transcription factor [Pararobbsia alpina]|uniref:Response regulator protein TmoT n=1 Tax=Pararobbsia alpina TaxID=621374 RepID=A0A6S7BEK1_9BURK|nr:response regulator [Pararobbsia alpina]CAB3797769.1 Response regulator protein TmoT [Pararobbsia alpina]
MSSPYIPVVHIVDDDDDMRGALAALLRAAGHNVRTYADAGHFLLSSIAQLQGCVLLDVRMPGPSGLDLQSALVERHSLIPIVFLSGQADVPMCAQALKAGALDFLTKPIRKEALLGAVSRALECDRLRWLAGVRASEAGELCETLTDRERTVAAGLASGKLNKEVAADLNLSERMIKNYRARIMKKLDIHSISRLVELLREADHRSDRPLDEGTEPSDARGRPDASGATSASAKRP